jgi:hypothetical protein
MMINRYGARSDTATIDQMIRGVSNDNIKFHQKIFSRRSQGIYKNRKRWLFILKLEEKALSKPAPDFTLSGIYAHEKQLLNFGDTFLIYAYPENKYNGLS